MSRFDSESLNAAHTQRHLDEIPQRGPSKPDFPIQAYAYTKADLNAETRELSEEVERLKADLEKSRALVFSQNLRHTSALMRAIGNRQAERDQAHEDYMALMDELNAEKELADDLEKVAHGVSWDHPARAAYRKARGL